MGWRAVVLSLLSYSYRLRPLVFCLMFIPSVFIPVGPCEPWQPGPRGTEWIWLLGVLLLHWPRRAGQSPPHHAHQGRHIRRPVHHPTTYFNKFPVGLSTFSANVIDTDQVDKKHNLVCIYCIGQHFLGLLFCLFPRIYLLIFYLFPHR